MTTPNIIMAPSPNYFSYNNGRQLIVLHRTAGSGSSALGWLRNPDSNASANYIIMKNGTIYCLVNPLTGFTAWANGDVNQPDLSNPIIASALKNQFNLNTVTLASIEHEAYTNEMVNRTPMTPEQQASSLALTTWLCSYFKLPADRTHVVGHYQINLRDRSNCPGIDVDGYVRDLSARLKPASTDPGGAPVPAPTDAWTPPETGFEVNNRYGFLDFYRAKGGLEIFGFPICPAFGYIDNGKRRVHQFFQRAEFQRDVQGPGDDPVPGTPVQLGLIGYGAFEAAKRS